MYCCFEVNHSGGRTAVPMDIDTKFGKYFFSFLVLKSLAFLCTISGNRVEKYIFNILT